MMSCRTGPLRVERAFARLFNFPTEAIFLVLPLVGMVIFFVALGGG
jgi:hypothetical protein